jgi:hypothetical protein
MESAALDNLVRTGKLKKEPPARAELETLIRSGDARLKDAANVSLALESRFDLAYNAAHRRRNAIEYEGVADVNEQLVAALLRVAAEVRKRLGDLVGLL